MFFSRIFGTQYPDRDSQNCLRNLLRSPAILYQLLSPILFHLFNPFFDSSPLPLPFLDSPLRTPPQKTQVGLISHKSFVPPFHGSLNPFRIMADFPELGELLFFIEDAGFSMSASLVFDVSLGRISTPPPAQQNHDRTESWYR